MLAFSRRLLSSAVGLTDFAKYYSFVITCKSLQVKTFFKTSNFSMCSNDTVHFLWVGNGFFALNQDLALYRNCFLIWLLITALLMKFQLQAYNSNSFCASI
jgi:hypothetical protein